MKNCWPVLIAVKTKGLSSSFLFLHLLSEVEAKEKVCVAANYFSKPPHPLLLVLHFEPHLH